MRGPQRRVEIGEQVLGILDAGRQAQQVGRAGRARPLRSRRGARSGSRRRRATSPASTARPAAAVAIAAASPPRTRIDSMPPKPPAICRAAMSWPGWVSQARDRAPRAPAGWPAKRCGEVSAVADAARTRRSSVRMPRISRIGLERAEDAAEHLAVALDPLQNSSRPRRRQRAGDHVGMAVELLCRRMHDDVGAERQRPGEDRRRDCRNRPRAGRPAAWAIVGQRRRCR